MNKLIKGSIAGAAGIALLLGGAGTLAYWNDSATIASAGTVSTGSLKIASTTAGAWTGLPSGVNIAAFKMVPGDSVGYSETFTVTAVGDNIKAELASTIPALTSGITGINVTPTFTVTKAGSPSTPVTPVAGKYNLTKGTYTVVATVGVAMPFGTAVDNTTQTKTVDLSAATVTVVQVP